MRQGKAEYEIRILTDALSPTLLIAPVEHSSVGKILRRCRRH